MLVLFTWIRQAATGEWTSMWVPQETEVCGLLISLKRVDENKAMWTVRLPLWYMVWRHGMRCHTLRYKGTCSWYFLERDALLPYKSHSWGGRWRGFVRQKAGLWLKATMKGPRSRDPKWRGASEAFCQRDGGGRTIGKFSFGGECGIIREEIRLFLAKTWLHSFISTKKF